MTGYLQWKLSFPGSGVYVGNTPSDVLRRISKKQHTDEDRSNVKTALAWRAWILTRTPLDTAQEDEDFIIAFAQTGLATLQAYGEERDEWLTF